jgi:integrase/recombinase XerD
LSWIGTAVTLHRPLARQKNASPTTVASYRDTCKLLLAFARHQTGKEPSSLSLANLNATLIGAFPSTWKR